MRMAAALIAAAAYAPMAKAEVLEAKAAQFTVRETAHVSVAPATAYAMMIQPQSWWSSAHSWSGSAANMTLSPKTGGCWCEALPDGGFAEHLRVIKVEPGKLLRMRGGLGPLQTLPVNGLMDWVVEPDPLGGSSITFTYQVSGNVKDGLESWAKPVDGVLAEAISRLAQSLDRPATD